MLSTSEIIKKYELITKKSFGQNFLVHADLIDKIVKPANVSSEDEILEIGTGPAGLTTAILRQNPKRLVSVDLDERCIEIGKKEILPYYDNLELLYDDALRIDENKLFSGKFKIISNLPYNVGTVLIFKWLEHYIDKISLINVLLQKEVVDRMAAKIATKDYGRISIMCQYLCDVKKQFDISPKAFLPAPKVTSTVVTLTPKKDIDLDIIPALSQLCKVAFNQKRKTIYNNLKGFYKNVSETLEKCNISEKVRAEELKIEDFVNLAKYKGLQTSKQL